MKRFARRAAIAVVALALLHACYCALVPVGGGDLRIVDIEPGTPVNGIARNLKESGVIRNEQYFRILARLVRKPLKSGEYAFKRATMLGVIRAMVQGRVYLHRFLVREGDALAQIAEALESEGLADPVRFKEVCANEKLSSGLGLPVSSAEGYLFPDTYFLPKRMKEERIVEIMVRRFFEKVPRDLITKPGKRGLGLHRLVTFASVVEKEAQVPAERAIIAGVFSNRLKAGMPLQADPTVLYALHRWDEKLTLKDLKADSLYNTYRHRGLPPGPICSPGLACLEAAAEPAKIRYLYFVTRKDGSGRHEFSSTLAEHERAVRRSKELARDKRQRNEE